mgnify:CR=1 FL=1
MSWKELKKLIVDTQAPTSGLSGLKIKSSTTGKESIKSEKQLTNSAKKNSVLDTRSGERGKGKQNLLLPALTSPKSLEASAKKPGLFKSPKAMREKPLLTLPK